MASVLIGVLGLKRSGKDTFAERLVTEHGFTRFAFADALKAAAYDLNPIIPFVSAPTHVNPPLRLAPYVDAVGWEKAKEHPEVRRLLQDFGVSVRDHIHPDAWVDAVARLAWDVSGPVVVTDVRFPNEVAWVEEQGHTVRVIRPGHDAKDSHISENAVNGTAVNFTVYNEGTIADLWAEADLIAEHIARL